MMPQLLVEGNQYDAAIFKGCLCGIGKGVFAAFEYDPIGTLTQTGIQPIAHLGTVKIVIVTGVVFADVHHHTIGIKAAYYLFHGTTDVV